MPTTLGRIQVTQTPPVQHALAIAAREWPDVPRAELINRLLAAGAQSLEAGHAERRTARRALLNSTKGCMAEAYPAGYLTELRQDWPE